MPTFHNRVRTAAKRKAGLHSGGRVLNSGVLSTLFALNIISTCFRVLKRRIFALNVKILHLIWRTYLNNLKISVF
jgi:hypothetical protein